MLTHIAQFYEDDGSYGRMQLSFLDAALRAGDTCIVLATLAHRQVLQDGLARCQASAGVALPAGYGHCAMVDAQQTLCRFMVGGELDEERFRTVMEDLLGEHVSSGGRRVWIFAEMVGLLVDAGQPEQALRLEACWAGLARANRQLSFSTVCSYPHHVLEQAQYRRWFPVICRAHSGVSLPL